MAKKKRKKKKKPVNRAAGVTAALFSVVYVLMILALVWHETRERNEVYSNSYNRKRIEVIEAEITRGTIYASDGTELAYTKADSEGKETRIYPYDDMFAHTVGYSAQGGMGLEKQMQEYLMSADISLSERLSNDLKESKDQGNSVYTSLDPAVQLIAYNSLGQYKGAVIVTEAKTGRILAMVSKPCFDPNSIEAEWDEISKDEINSPLMNRASQGLYPPGSTFKIISTLEYLREHPTDWSKYYYNCSGKITKGDTTIRCFHGTVHGGLDLKGSFAKSCNSSFANIGLGLDRTKFAQTLESLMFNQVPPVDFEANPSHISMRENMTEENIMQTAIGQSETLVTPLQMNMVTLAIANDGVMMKPYMVDKVVSSDGNIIKSYAPKPLGTVMTAEEVAVMRSFMEAVVQSGTATALKGLPYTAAGKTGSAEISDSSDISHAWFTGYAPADDPVIVVTVIMERAGTGGSTAVPVAQRILSGYFGRRPNL
ncbi:MAG: penicillin-binding protein 2 [Lachnospiraceae bacterium]|nr:penicillin-binding protein 2 [Lachnospiraceae bacterium]